MTVARSAYDSLTRWVRIWSVVESRGSAAPSSGSHEQKTPRESTQACAGLAEAFRSALTSQFRHPAAQFQTHPFATLCAHGEPWGIRGAPRAGWHHGQGRAVIRRRDGGWLRGAGDRHRVAGADV